MNYHKITKTDVANGTGVRVVLWVSGCNHHCKGCHNPETWDENNGKPFTEDTMNELLEALKPDYISGLTFSGGDPLFLNNRDEITKIASIVKQQYPNKTIWLYTGYKWSEVIYLPIMKYIDTLVDGEFIEEEKDISLEFRGSRNQRVIDVVQTLGEVEE